MDLLLFGTEMDEVYTRKTFLGTLVTLNRSRKSETQLLSADHRYSGLGPKFSQGLEAAIGVLVESFKLCVGLLEDLDVNFFVEGHTIVVFRPLFELLQPQEFE